ncbi:small ribosomal subunit protein uS17 isoform X1 [Malania oleifera]|uniref:small ribosomal subunit protein uS17 isoform X1 n=1 Tax=Malania oleifera TaxID=397392 RepID=UPI0025AE729D|nr:small ribosomal subunit protein uS17 isoform X1 [Malania oleifera]
MAEQTEKAFLKQPKVFLCSKKSGKGKRPGKGGNRFWKSVGLGFKTPKEAIEGAYIDKKCPFTGNVSIRGRIIAGTCHSAKMMRTIIVRRNYLHYVKKYQRYEKRHSNIPAHISPCFRVKEGDHVIIGQCRFNLLLKRPFLFILSVHMKCWIGRWLSILIVHILFVNYHFLQAIVKDRQVQCFESCSRWIFRRRWEEGFCSHVKFVF